MEPLPCSGCCGSAGAGAVSGGGVLPLGGLDGRGGQIPFPALKTNKEVANVLNIGLTTVETHRGHILQKLSLHSIPELILYAVRKGIIS